MTNVMVGQEYNAIDTDGTPDFHNYLFAPWWIASNSFSFVPCFNKNILL